MNLCLMSRRAFACALFLPVFAAQAKVVFKHGFESYPAGSAINGQPIGTGAWSASGVIAGDLAQVTDAQAAEGAQALLIADNGANRPRASVNLVTSGHVTAPIAAGAVSFAMREDPNDGGLADAFAINIGAMSLTRAMGTSLWFSVTGGGGRTVSFAGTGYTYAPGAWNTLRVEFDNATKSATLFINGGNAGTITGSSADFTVGTITLGAYASASTGDALFFDELEATLIGNHFAGGFESYTAGANIAGLAAGSTTWTTQGVVTGDLARVEAGAAADGANALRIADNGANRPRASLNLVSGGFISAPASAGALFFALKEDDADAGAIDSFTLNLGTMTLSNAAASNRLTLSVTGGSFSLPIPYSTSTYTYTPGAWNAFGLKYDNAAKAASLYINGGYAGSVNAPLASAVDFSMGSLTFGTYSSGAVGDSISIDAIYGDFNGAEGVFEWRSALYPADWTPGFANGDGRFLHDFSYAGYHRGEAEPPIVAGPIHNAVTGYGADPTGATDSTAAIQAAINAAGTAGGGVVLLPAGTYKVAPIGASVSALRLDKPNVVLRGAGAAQTFIHNTNPVMKNKSVILAQAATATNWYAGNNSAALTSDLTAPTTTIPVASTAAYAVGDLIVIRNDLTQDFMEEIGMWGKPGWTVPGPNYPGRMLTFCRRVTAKTATTLEVDVPTRFPIRIGDNARVLKPTAAMLREVGIEDLSVGMTQTGGTLNEGDWNVPGTGGYNADRSFAVRMIAVENGWIARVRSYRPAGNTSIHLLSNGIDLSTSRFITVTDCDLRHAQYKGANGNGYLITVAGQECLVRDTRLEDGRHNVSVNMMHASGNVVLRAHLTGPSKTTDFHQFLSPANLFDGTVCDGVMLETRYRGEVSSPTPGWTTVQSVFWNTRGLNYGDSTDGTSTNRLISSYQLNGDGFVIGTQGPAFAVTSSDFVEGVGRGAALIPESLYEDQLARRLGP